LHSSFSGRGSANQYTGENTNTGGNSNRSVQNASHAVSLVDIERYMKGIEFSADKHNLITRAEENGASPEILDRLERFKDGENYQNATDISKSYASIP
jgi:hypothetical protein